VLVEEFFEGHVAVGKNPMESFHRTRSLFVCITSSITGPPE